MSAMAWMVAGILALPSATSLHVKPMVDNTSGPPVLDKVDIEEHLGQGISLDLPFVDSSNHKVTLQNYFRPQRPVVLVLAYYRCPTLCSLVLGGMTKAIQGAGLKLGDDYQVVTVSIDPKETARLALERKRTHLESLGRNENDDSWHFLTGEAGPIAKLADEVGFRYAYDASSNQYAHAAAVVVLTPGGKVARYLYGVTYPPRDLKLALVEASDGRVGTSFDRVLLKCFKYDPSTRRYAFYVSSMVRGGAFVVFAALFAGLAVFWRRELKRGTVV